jgi:hypothetical protein
MLNDYGSVAHDWADCNFNCLGCRDFGGEDETGKLSKAPKELSGGDIRLNVSATLNGPGATKPDSQYGSNHLTVSPGMSSKKKDLLNLAKYEQGNVSRTLEFLETSRLNTSTMNALQLLVNVTNLYGQIYITRDIGISIANGK